MSLVNAFSAILVSGICRFSHLSDFSDAVVVVTQVDDAIDTRSDE
jgi:hypothetical protein